MSIKVSRSWRALAPHMLTSKLASSMVSPASASATRIASALYSVMACSSVLKLPAAPGTGQGVLIARACRVMTVKTVIKRQVRQQEG